MIESICTVDRFTQILFVNVQFAEAFIIDIINRRRCNTQLATISAHQFRRCMTGQMIVECIVFVYLQKFENR